MANIRSARKRIRSSARKHEQNRVVRSAVRTMVAKARRAVLAGEDGDGRSLVVAASALDKAAEHGIIHPRNAARRKSRLMRLANREQVASAVEASARPAAARGSLSKAAATSKRAAATSKSSKKITKTARTEASARRAAAERKD